MSATLEPFDTLKVSEALALKQRMQPSDMTLLPLKVEFQRTCAKPDEERSPAVPVETKGYNYYHNS